MHDVLKPIENRWDGYVHEDWMTELDRTSFLSRCQSGLVTKKELHSFLIQQYFYARQFTRYLCALLSNIPEDSDRRELTANLVDETGLGVAKGIPHSILYRQMMERMGVDPLAEEMSKSTAALIDTMLESCRSPNAAIGLGALCLGAEAIVPHIYAKIVKGFESNGYTKEDLDFFYLHMACDDEHALTMKKIIDREMGSPRQMQMLKCSAKRVIAARARFFDSIGIKKEVNQYASI